MPIRFVLIAILSSLLFSARGQLNPLIVPPNVILPKDANTRSQLIDSLNGFLAAKQKNAGENAFVFSEARLDTALLLDELKGMEKSLRDKDNVLYKPYLLNCAPLSETNFLVQFSYLGQLDNVLMTRGIFRLLAVPGGNQFYFSSPLRQNAATWKHESIGSCIFHYKQTFNTAGATKYEKLVASFDARLKVSGQVIEFFCCDSLPDALQLFGVDYKSDYNSYSSTSFSTHEGRNTLVVNGALTGAFNTFDPHDLWHARLHNVLSTTIINRPVDEGCAYLYGGSWGISWEDILKRFKEKLATNPQADWLNLYEGLYNFGDSEEKHLYAAYVINALIVQKLEREKGFDPVMELLGCGKYEKGNENYFKALEKITGITKANFNDEVWKLVKASTSAAQTAR